MILSTIIEGGLLYYQLHIGLRAETKLVHVQNETKDTKKQPKIQNDPLRIFSKSH